MSLSEEQMPHSFKKVDWTASAVASTPSECSLQVFTRGAFGDEAYSEPPDHRASIRPLCWSCCNPAVQAEAQSTALRRFQGRVTQWGSRVTLLREGQRAGSQLPLQHLLLLMKPGPRRHFTPAPHMTLGTITPETVFTDCYCISLNVT